MPIVDEIDLWKSVLRKTQIVYFLYFSKIVPNKLAPKWLLDASLFFNIIPFSEKKQLSFGIKFLWYFHAISWFRDFTLIFELIDEFLAPELVSQWLNSGEMEEVPCCHLLLATCLTHLAYLGCAFLLDWQNIGLSRKCSCQFLPFTSKKAQPRYAKCVRQVARSKRQHGTCHRFLVSFGSESGWIFIYMYCSVAITIG